jgi:flavin-binding protein dodecin
MSEIAPKIVHDACNQFAQGGCRYPECKDEAVCSAIVRACKSAHNEAIESAAKVAMDYAQVANVAQHCGHCEEGYEAGLEIFKAIRALKVTR